ncbi:MAG: glycosyltransferase, partial [Ideonella sp.]
MGSAGDLHPFLAIARALAERGADVRLASQEPHRAEVESQGVRFESIVSAHDHHRTAAHPDLWHPVNGFGVLWRHLAVPAIGPTIELIARLDAESPRGLTVLASPLAVGARLAAEVRQIRHVTGITAPSALRSHEDPMLLGPWQVPSWLPAAPRRWLWKALDRWKLEPMAANAVQHWREQLGLAPLCEPIFDQWIHSSREIMGLYPKAFAHPPREWASKLELHGFPLYETQVVPELDPELWQYLGQAERLVVFYPGSVPTAAGELMSESAQQIAKSGISVLLIGPESAESEAT